MSIINPFLSNPTYNVEFIHDNLIEIIDSYFDTEDLEIRKVLREDLMTLIDSFDDSNPSRTRFHFEMFLLPKLYDILPNIIKIYRYSFLTFITEISKLNFLSEDNILFNMVKVFYKFREYFDDNVISKDEYHHIISKIDYHIIDDKDKEEILNNFDEQDSDLIKELDSFGINKDLFELKKFLQEKSKECRIFTGSFENVEFVEQYPDIVYPPNINYNLAYSLINENEEKDEDNIQDEIDKELYKDLIELYKLKYLDFDETDEDLIRAIIFEEKKSKQLAIFLSKSISDKILFLREKYSEYFEDLKDFDDSALFNLFGPINVNLNSDECIEIGGCRMLSCSHFEEKKDAEDGFYCYLETDEEMFQDIEKFSWFTGICKTCDNYIESEEYAVRKPLEDGGWEGCYCKWDHIIDPTNIETIKIEHIKEQFKNNKIHLIKSNREF